MPCRVGLANPHGHRDSRLLMESQIFSMRYTEQERSAEANTGVVANDTSRPTGPSRHRFVAFNEDCHRHVVYRGDRRLRRNWRCE
jgi:hypothetical protein